LTKPPRVGGEPKLIAAVEADFTDWRAVGLKSSPAGAAGLVHLVIAVAGGGNGMRLGEAGEGPGDASEGALAVNKWPVF
jgi:hypothetical protein